MEICRILLHQMTAMLQISNPKKMQTYQIFKEFHQKALIKN